MITVNNPEQKLFPGMTADVSILVAERTNVLKIPNTALRYTPPETALFEQSPPTRLGPGQRLVYKVAPAGIKLTPLLVKVGLSDGVDTEVLSGMTEGTSLVTATLSGGAKSGGFGGPPPQAP